MNNSGIAGQALNQLKGLGQETGQQLGQAGEEIVKGTVKELLGSDQGGQVEQRNREGVPQQAPVMDEMEELRQRKAAEKQRGLKRVRDKLESYRNWQKQMKKELAVEEDEKEAQMKEAKKEAKKEKKRKPFWSGFLDRIRSQHGGTGETMKTKH